MCLGANWKAGPMGREVYSRSTMAVEEEQEVWVATPPHTLKSNRSRTGKRYKQPSFYSANSNGL